MRYGVGVLLMGILLLGATIAWRIEPVPQPRAIASGTTHRNHASAEPDVQMVDLRLMAQLGDKTILHVVAKRAISSGVKQQAIVHDIRGKMQQEGGLAWRIAAARGVVDRETGDMTARGSVRLYEQNGYVIETEKLSLHAAERVLQTDTAVTIHGHTVSIAGTGLRHEMDNDRITLQHQVKASFLIPSDAVAADHRDRRFDDGTARAGSASDAVSGH